MNSPAEKTTNKWKYIIGIALGILFACNVVILIILFKTNAKLEKHNQILLTVPNELHTKILQKFQETAASSKKDISTIHNNVSSAIKTDAEKNLPRCAKI